MNASLARPAQHGARKRRLGMLLVVGAAAMAGCGGDAYQLATVKGKILCNGQPAVGGMIVLDPIDDPKVTGRPTGEPGRASRAMVGEDGTFVLVIDARGTEQATEGAIVGRHRVSFSLPNTKPVAWNREDDWLPEDEKAKLKAEIALIKVFKPLACGAAISPGEVEVKPGANSFEFTLAEGRQKSSGP